MTTLINPYYNIGGDIADPLEVHGDKRETNAEIDLLEFQ